MEWIFSGYCRTQDQARTVMLEWYNGSWECDCDFPDCAYAAACPIGKQMNDTQKEHTA